MATKKGMVKKAKFDAFLGVRRSGILAMKLKKGDILGWVGVADKGSDIMMFTKKGQAIRFEEKKLREMGRQAQGVRGIRVGSSDEIISLQALSKNTVNQQIFVVSALGFGKKTDSREFKVQSRGGMGVKAMNVSDSTGPLVAARVVDDSLEEFIAISEKGKTLRSFVKEMPTLKRATRGVKIMKLESHDRLGGVAVL